MWTPNPEDVITADQRATEARQAQIVPLTPRQLRLVMVHIGLSETDVEAAIAAISGAEDRANAEVEWRWATQYQREHRLVEHLRAAMDFGKDEFDDLWIWAVSL